MLKLIIYSALSLTIALVMLGIASRDPGQHQDSRAALQNTESVSNIPNVNAGEAEIIL